MSIEGIESSLQRAAKSVEFLGETAGEIEVGFFRIIKDIEGSTISFFDPNSPVLLAYQNLLRKDPKLAIVFEDFSKGYHGILKGNADSSAKIFSFKKTSEFADNAIKHIDTKIGELNKTGGAAEEIAVYSSAKSHIEARKQYILEVAANPKTHPNPPIGTSKKTTKNIGKQTAADVAKIKKLEDLAAKSRLLALKASQNNKYLEVIVEMFPEKHSFWTEMAEKLEATSVQKLGKDGEEGVITQIQGLLAEKLIMQHPGFTSQILEPMWLKARSVAESLGDKWKVKVLDQPIYMVKIPDGAKKAIMGESYDISIVVVNEERKECFAFFTLQVKSGKRDDSLAQILRDIDREAHAMKTAESVKLTKNGLLYDLVPPPHFETQRAVAGPYIPSFEKMKVSADPKSQPIIIPFGLGRGETELSNLASSAKANPFAMTATDLRNVARELQKAGRDAAN